jgi:bifunctional UDP-N-acetylglucosamine pyrophosphorylase/glucosamine-1-phosphate N-acetyltransferase
MKNIAAIILAAGQGKRMKSDLPKVLHKIGEKPILEYVINTAKDFGFKRILVVIGHKAELVEEFLKDKDVEIVWQKEQLGTGHAVLQTKEVLKNFEGEVVILSGDVPGLRKKTIQGLIEVHRRSKALGTVLTAVLNDPKEYGRIVRGKDGLVEKIVENKDAKEEEKKIKEINTGIFVFEKKPLFEALEKTNTLNRQGEYYLTDVLEIFRKQNLIVAAKIVEDNWETEGINSIEQLAKMENYLAHRFCRHSVE